MGKLMCNVRDEIGVRSTFVVVTCLFLCNCLSSNKSKSPSVQLESKQGATATESLTVRQSTTDITSEVAGWIGSIVFAFISGSALWSRRRHGKAVDRLVDSIEHMPSSDARAVLKEHIRVKGIRECEASGDNRYCDSVQDLIHCRVKQL